MKALFLIIATGFRDEEYLIPKQLFEEKGLEVVTASTTTGKIAGKKGLTTAESTLLLTDIDSQDYEVLVIVGGGRDFWNNKNILTITKAFANQDKVIGAICSSAVIPAQAGLLKGQKTTAFNDEPEKTEATKHGAQYTGNSVEVVDKIITARDADCSEEFAKALLAKIIDQ